MYKYVYMYSYVYIYIYIYEQHPERGHAPSTPWGRRHKKQSPGKDICKLISHNVLIKQFQKVNSPTKSSTCCVDK